MRSFHLAGQNLNASWSWESFSHLLVHSTSVVVLSLAVVLCPALWILTHICLICSPRFMGTPKQMSRVYPLQSSLLSSAYIPTATGAPNSDLYLLGSASRLCSDCPLPEPQWGTKLGQQRGSSHLFTFSQE